MSDVTDQVEAVLQDQTPEAQPESPEPQAQPEAPQEESQSLTPEQVERIRVENENYKRALREERRKRRSQTQESGTLPQGGQRGTQDNTGQMQQYVQSLEQQVAINQLKDGAKEVLRDFPDMPKHLKQAILRNPRGWVASDTTNVKDGIEDIREYLEDESANWSTPKPPKKEVQVAGGNRPDGTQSGATPAEIQAILDTPVDEWTKDQRAALNEYKKSHT